MRKMLAGEPPVELELKRSARARRFSLRISRLDGKVTLSMPAHARESDALAFAQSQADWIRRTQARSAPVLPVAIGAEIPLFGQPHRIVAAPVRAPRLVGGEILVPPDADRVGARVQALLKLTARDRLQAASDHYSDRIGRRHSGLTLRDTRSRWGSCSSSGQLMYSWRLVMAPPEVLNYVAAHEVAHLAQMNHSPAFWAVVRGLMPEYEGHRAWLKRHGTALHRYDFP